MLLEYLLHNTCVLSYNCVFTFLCIFNNNQNIFGDNNHSPFHCIHYSPRSYVNCSVSCLLYDIRFRCSLYVDEMLLNISGFSNLMCSMRIRVWGGGGCNVETAFQW